MDKVTLFPMNRTESGNLVLQSFDDTTLNGTNLVFVDALRAQHFGLTDQVKSTWVECRDSEEMTYPEFCSKEAVALEGVKLVPYMERCGAMVQSSRVFSSGSSASIGAGPLHELLADHPPSSGRRLLRLLRRLRGTP